MNADNGSLVQVSRQQALTLLADQNARYATVAFVDHHGQLRRKSMSAEKIRSAMDGGLGFSPYTFLLDLGDRPLRPAGFSADVASEDNACTLVLDAPRTLPFEEPDANLFFFAEFAPGTLGHGWDPRAVYRRAEQRLDGLGLRPWQALEYEFRVLRETEATARAKHFRNLELLDAGSVYGGAMCQGAYDGFFRELRQVCATLEVPVESLHWEMAPSMGEVALRYRPGILAADDAVLFKNHARLLAQRHGLLMTFMALPFSGSDGQSGHVHLSLRGPADTPSFHDAKAPGGISETMRYFIGGVCRLLPELLLMLAPNVNSMKRLSRGHFAPVAANWGIDNRTTAVRVIPGGPDAQRLECRVAGSDANPYLVLAAINGAGAWGIEQRIDPTEPFHGSTYLNDERVSSAARLPASFHEAVARFGDSAVARELFGESFVSAFAGTREAQAREMAAMVTDIELERFLALA